LRGRLVTLRPWAAADADWVFAACQDEVIQQWTVVPSPYLRVHAVEYVTSIASAAYRDGGGVFAVAAADTGELTGTIGVHGMTDGLAHVGYWTAAAARRRGYTTDALRVVTRWFLREKGAARVELVVEPGNVGSVRAAVSAGYTAEGLLRQRAVIRGRRVDVVMYSILPTDEAAALLD
jgi:RimJ/RimL family protein N-acetyltransferase